MNGWALFPGRASLRGNQGAGGMGKYKKVARRTGKIYKGAGRINLIWEQGAGKRQKLEEWENTKKEQ